MPEHPSRASRLRLSFGPLTDNLSRLFSGSCDSGSENQTLTQALRFQTETLRQKAVEPSSTHNLNCTRSGFLTLPFLADRSGTVADIQFDDRVKKWQTMAGSQNMNPNINSLKIVTKWFQGEATGLWGIIGLVVVIAALVATLLIMQGA